jgi:acetyltransferase-like isoleucine patch superfamily enzyme
MEGEILMKKFERIAFENLSYLENICYLIIEIIPPLFRRLVYKIVFRKFGSNVHIGEKFYCRYPWKVTIGNNVNLGRSTQIIASLQVSDAYVVIEDNVMCAPNLTILGAGHPVDNPQDSHIAASVTIRKNAYIGANVVIRYGVEIGENSVIAAGSVIIKDVPPNSIWGGNPAQIIRMK